MSARDQTTSLEVESGLVGGELTYASIGNYVDTADDGQSRVGFAIRFYEPVTWM
jgi:hypothetical protein